jgi:hypothetical protein
MARRQGTPARVAAAAPGGEGRSAYERMADMSEEHADYVVKPPPAGSPVAEAMRMNDETYLRVLNAFMVECIDLIEELTRQHTFTDEETKITSSGGISADADALKLLARHGRFRITHHGGRMVAGYLPEHVPASGGHDGQG